MDADEWETLTMEDLCEGANDEAREEDMASDDLFDGMSVWMELGGSVLRLDAGLGRRRDGGGEGASGCGASARFLLKSGLGRRSRSMSEYESRSGRSGCL